MVKIRLTRTGKRNQPHYRIVAADVNAPRDGRFIEKIGYYNPRTKPSTVTYNKEILDKWISCGAQFTDTTYDIFVKEGVLKQSPKRKARINTIKKANDAAKAESNDAETNDAGTKPATSESKDTQKSEE